MGICIACFITLAFFPVIVIRKKHIQFHLQGNAIVDWSLIHSKIRNIPNNLNFLTSYLENLYQFYDNDVHGILDLNIDHPCRPKTVVEWRSSQQRVSA